MTEGGAYLNERRVSHNTVDRAQEVNVAIHGFFRLDIDEMADEVLLHARCAARLAETLHYGAEDAMVSIEYEARQIRPVNVCSELRTRAARGSHAVLQLIAALVEGLDHAVAVLCRLLLLEKSELVLLEELRIDNPNRRSNEIHLPEEL